MALGRPQTVPIREVQDRPGDILYQAEGTETQTMLEQTKTRTDPSGHLRQASRSVSDNRVWVGLAIHGGDGEG